MAAPAPVPPPGLIKSSVVATAAVELFTAITGASCASKLTELAPTIAVPGTIMLPADTLPDTDKLASVPSEVKLELTMFEVSVLPVKNSAGAAMLTALAAVN